MGNKLLSMLCELAGTKSVKDASCEALGGSCTCQIFYAQGTYSNSTKTKIYKRTYLKYQCRLLGWKGNEV